MHEAHIEAQESAVYSAQSLGPLCGPRYLPIGGPMLGSNEAHLIGPII